MKADVIRDKFLRFFQSKQHKIIPSASLVPDDDPTLLFTGAGMNQFKEYFLGIKKDFKRATTSQKCLRTGDIENVGKTPAHHTFFEMLGNFSFGDYFKKDAIAWAWEFMAEELKIPQKKMWVSVYKDDDEAYDIWRNVVKIPADKIKKLGDKDNFWPSEAKQKGPNGPCGPCSEIYVGDVEVWNLVFTQFNRCEGGKLEALPIKNIDTGMGLERIAAVMQGVKSNFETDLFVPIIEVIKNEAARAAHPEMAATIADHVRAAIFLCADGVLPSNEGRGYVQRMLIRRAVRFGKKLGIKGEFLYKLVPVVARVMKKQYPQLEARRENISMILLKEEERFSKTLHDGEQILQEIMKNSFSKQIKGEEAFKLYDTYGFPYDLTEEIAKEKGFYVDKDGFNKAMEAQRVTSRSSIALSTEIFAVTLAQKIKKLVKHTQFTGYDGLTSEAKVLQIFKNEEPVKEAKENDQVWIALDETPFYGESGGQVGDTGQIKASGALLEVLDTKSFDKIIIHICNVKKGSIKTGDNVTAQVDARRRLDIARNHTATHLLHGALRKTLGEHVHQAGSLVASERLRFDFAHFKALTPEQIKRVEELVNQDIQKDFAVSTKEMDLKEANKSGAQALFTEKYSDTVRVVSAGDNSRELCGGTHLENTGAIESFKIISESSVSAGMRRIEAVTGIFVSDVIKREKIAAQQKAAKEKEDKVSTERDKARRSGLLNNTDAIIKGSKIINGIKVVASELPDADVDDLRSICDKVRQLEPLAAILLVSHDNDKVSYVIAFSQDLVKKGFNAAKTVKDISRVVDGGGGGRPDLAVGGGKKPSGIKDLIKKFEQSLVTKRDSE
ncbi:MAG: alanine--tRNA ligase [Candidatus Omnitrophica bacterium CG1_02_43_210]|nr:MAG: alanine--tRNA ligase [Candidatus Omnitrophica bacterium CG1_02_43_210]